MFISISKQFYAYKKQLADYEQLLTVEKGSLGVLASFVLVLPPMTWLHFLTWTKVKISIILLFCANTFSRVFIVTVTKKLLLLQHVKT